MYAKFIAIDFDNVNFFLIHEWNKASTEYPMPSRFDWISQIVFLSKTLW